METYTDFHLHIAQDGEISAASAEGERSGSIPVSVAGDLALLVQRVADDDTDEDLLKEIGLRLQALLLPGPIDTHFNQTEAVARSLGRKIRIRLTVDTDGLAQLPWELTYRRDGGYFLAVHPWTAFSRYLRLPTPPAPVRRRAGPLHLLLIISSPRGYPAVDGDEWEQVLTGALAKPLGDGSLAMTVVKQATRREIGNALLDQSPDIVQFMGHGVYKNGKGHLALVDGNSGDPWFVDDARFADIFLSAGDRLGLLCLATCQSAQSDSPRSFLGIAPQLVQRGVPATVAMQYDLRFSTAKVFLEEFYKAVAARKPVDWAVQWARNQIALETGPDRRDFATPVLFMRASDGDVFGSVAATAEREPGPGPQWTDHKVDQSTPARPAEPEAGGQQPVAAQPLRTDRAFLIALRETLITRFSDGELRDLCFDLGVDYDSLPGEGKAAKARELIAYMQRRERVGALVSRVQQLRPDIGW